jgi:threonine dehydrogenase-like Zn-dependent dehydrogenase
MRGVVLHAPGDIRVENRPDPRIENPTDAIIRLAATCVCGSDLWPYRGIEPVSGPSPMGHEYVGVVEEVGGDVRDIKPGQFVVGSFFASDNTCQICQTGYQSRCVHAELVGVIGTRAQYARIPLADGTLVATPARVGLLEGEQEFEHPGVLVGELEVRLPAVESGDGGHLVGGELEVEDVDVLA